MLKARTVMQNVYDNLTEIKRYHTQHHALFHFILNLSDGMITFTHQSQMTSFI